MGRGMNNTKVFKDAFGQQLMKSQEAMSQVIAEGSAGNGLVKITLNSEGITRLKIDPVCVDPTDVEALEDLIMAAHKNASAELRQQMDQIGNQFSLPF
jgi:DNA-binding YbaB/EbfC family protein